MTKRSSNWPSETSPGGFAAVRGGITGRPAKDRAAIGDTPGMIPTQFSRRQETLSTFWEIPLVRQWESEPETSTPPRGMGQAAG